MTAFQIFGTILSLVAILGYINVRFIKLPITIGMTAISMVVSFSLVILSLFFPKMTEYAQAIIEQINFTDVVFHGLLGFLLFAGALHVKYSDMARHKWPIITLATLGVVISTVVIGFIGWSLGSLAGLKLDGIWYFIFGALISPTDPIAVLSLLKQVGAPKEIETKIAGESLFNDGTAVAVFMVLLAIAKAGDMTFSQALSMGAVLLMKEAIGGILVGLAVGFGAIYLLKTIDSYEVETTITLALATGGYALAEALHTSAPLAVVIMGLVVGNLGKQKIMSDTTQERLFNFWELLDEILNLVLFAMVGLYVIAFEHTWKMVIIGLVAVPIVLFARFVSVALPLTTIRQFNKVYPHSIKILTWAGLRGAVSIALVLSLPNFNGKDYLIVGTYCVVLFSLLAQGLTMKKFLKKTLDPKKQCCQEG